ncbi:hypothetical protein IG631_20154 [Alternaria alternata]|nr:hypothetical protein IG631_20154 [Alternaria alternata]
MLYPPLFVAMKRGWIGVILADSYGVTNTMICKGDIIYLLDVGRKQISAYPWALEVRDTPLPAEADLLASVASLEEIRSSRKEDAERQTQQDPNKPYPEGFDASKKESVDRIAIKIQPQLWEKNNGEIKILRYDAWFQRKNIPFYPWKCDDKVETAATPSTSPAPAHSPSSPNGSTSLDAYGITLPHNVSTDTIYPANFDPSGEQNHNRIFITMGKQDVGESCSDIERELFADMPWVYDYVARLKADEYTLVKGAAEDSEAEAMSELFRHVNLLANNYRQMEKEAS